MTQETKNKTQKYFFKFVKSKKNFFFFICIIFQLINLGYGQILTCAFEVECQELNLQSQLTASYVAEWLSCD